MSDEDNFLKKLSSEFTNVTITVLSIIQGFAFNQLAEIFSANSDVILSFKNPIYSFNFLFCFLILIRIFQTYMLAAIHYTNWRVSFTDIVSMFVTRFLQFWIFSTLSNTESFNYQDLHLRASVIMGIAAVLYLIALWKISNESEALKLTKSREYKIQFINSSFALSAAGMW